MRNLRKCKLILLGLLCIAATSTGLAQDDNTDFHTLTITIPEVALLDIETTGAGNNITLGPTDGQEAGLPLDFSSVSNDELWLNYSSIINTTAGETSRTVSVSVAGTVPTGMSLGLTIANSTGSGGGTLGTVIGGGGSTFPLGGGPQDIIESIGSCYTGNGGSNGHQLTYDLDMNLADYASLDASSTALTVTYTISDN